MRINIKVIVNQKELPLDMNRTVLSYIKHAMEKYDEKLYKAFYEKTNIAKPFSFSLYLPGAKFEKEKILISENYFCINITTADKRLGSVFYNMFVGVKGEKYPFGSAKGVCLEINAKQPKNINVKSVIVKFSSPLALRKRENNKDVYFCVNDVQFEDIFKDLINYELSLFGKKADESISIKAIKGKNIVKKTFGLNVPCSIGTFLISGDVDTLNFISKAGAGSRRSEGFGMFDVVMEVA